MSSPLYQISPLSSKPSLFIWAAILTEGAIGEAHSKERSQRQVECTSIDIDFLSSCCLGDHSVYLIALKIPNKFN